MKARRLAVAAVAFAVVQVCTDLPAHAQSVLGEPVSETNLPEQKASLIMLRRSNAH